MSLTQDKKKLVANKCTEVCQRGGSVGWNFRPERWLAAGIGADIEGGGKVFMPVFPGKCVRVKQPNHVSPARSFHAMKKRHFPPHQSTPDPCICCGNSAELEQESSFSSANSPPTFSSQKASQDGGAAGASWRTTPGLNFIYLFIFKTDFWW